MPSRTEPTDLSPHIKPTQYLTADVPPIGGKLRTHLEDFIVEEVPLYQPSGEGEHVYLFLQKVNLSTTQLVQIVAKHFRVRPMAVGYAGLKDKRAVTRQVISVHVPGKKLDQFPALQHERVQVLWADMHSNKLRRGHLKANRFAIKVRDIELSSVLRAKKVLDTLERSGVPNRAGQQRFGFFANNHIVARHMILGDFKGALDELLAPKPPEAYPPGHVDPMQLEAREHYVRGEYFKAFNLMPPGATTECECLRALNKGATPEQAINAINPTQKSFFISGFQSSVFNAVLDRRMSEGSFAKVLEGDLAFKHANGAVFAVTPEVAADPETTRRLEVMEISPSGPNWGVSMIKPTGHPAQIELDALHAAGVTEDDLKAFAARTGEEVNGDRRALRVPLMYTGVEAGADEHGLFLRCVFELPPGAFATTVMQEVMKTEVAVEAVGE